MLKNVKKIHHLLKRRLYYIIFKKRCSAACHLITTSEVKDSSLHYLYRFHCF